MDPEPEATVAAAAEARTVELAEEEPNVEVLVIVEKIWEAEASAVPEMDGAAEEPERGRVVTTVEMSPESFEVKSSNNVMKLVVVAAEEETKRQRTEEQRLRRGLQWSPNQFQRRRHQQVLLLAK